MKRFLSIIAIAGLICAISSCEKDKGLLPNISFKTGTGYTSNDASVAQNTVVLIGINASKSEDKDVLKTFEVTQMLDSGTPTSVYSETLSGSNGDNYSKDLTFTTRAVAGTEKYTFTVVNRDGLVNSVSLIITTP
ncbi:MAG: hypothetical protein ABIO04_07275 [Ferruginibacter sp.]